MNTGMPVESRMRGNSHVRFGGRPGETERPKRRHRAPRRPYLANEAVNEVRRAAWNEHGKSKTTTGRWIKGVRWPLVKAPERHTVHQAAKLAEVQHANKPLYRAFLLKEELRQIYRLPAKQAIALLERWLQWARRCRLPAFVKLARTITDQRAGILAAIEHRLSNECPSHCTSW
ncbi:MAG: transposase [Actinobacteria bacterium]|nr:transposase [Actinomycetota bacterium]